MCAGATLLLMMSAGEVMAQVSRPKQRDVEQRVDKFLAALTLDEKLEVLGGDRSFYIHALPSIGMPAIKMSDGPLRGADVWVFYRLCCRRFAGGSLGPGDG